VTSAPSLVGNHRKAVPEDVDAADAERSERTHDQSAQLEALREDLAALSSQVLDLQEQVQQFAHCTHDVIETAAHREINQYLVQLALQQNTILVSCFQRIEKELSESRAGKHGVRESIQECLRQLRMLVVELDRDTLPVGDDSDGKFADSRSPVNCELGRDTARHDPAADAQRSHNAEAAGGETRDESDITNGLVRFQAEKRRERSWFSRHAR
jgi:hypothetical protein